MRQDRVELFEDKGGEWRWRLRAPNGDVIASSGEGFRRKWGARRAARRVLRSAPEPPV